MNQCLKLMIEFNQSNNDMKPTPSLFILLLIYVLHIIYEEAQNRTEDREIIFEKVRQFQQQFNIFDDVL